MYIVDHDDLEHIQIIKAGSCFSSRYLSDSSVDSIFTDMTQEYVRTCDVGKWANADHLKIVGVPNLFSSFLKVNHSDMVTQVYDDCNAT